MSKPIDICISGPLSTAPSLMGAMMALFDSKQEIGNIYASGGGILVALIIGSGYRPDAESTRVLTKMAGTNIRKRTYKNLWLRPKFKSAQEIALELDRFFSKSFSSFSADSFFAYYDTGRDQIRELGFSNGMKPVSMLLPILSVDKNFSHEKLLSHKLASLELSPLLADFLENVDADIYIRGTLETSHPSSGNIPKILEQAYSHMHLPSNISDRTLFINSGKESDFFNLSQTNISRMVGEGFEAFKAYFGSRGWVNVGK